MVTNMVTIRKPSGFQYSMTTSVVYTPKGAIRTIEIIDHEVSMTDKEPTDRFVMCFNEKALDTNTEQLKEFCEFVLKEIKRSKQAKRPKAKKATKKKK